MQKTYICSSVCPSVRLSSTCVSVSVSVYGIVAKSPPVIAHQHAMGGRFLSIRHTETHAQKFAHPCSVHTSLSSSLSVCLSVPQRLNLLCVMHSFRTKPCMASTNVPWQHARVSPCLSQGWLKGSKIWSFTFEGPSLDFESRSVCLCLSLCLSFRLSVGLSVLLSVCVSLSPFLSLCLLVCLSVPQRLILMCVVHSFRTKPHMASTNVP